MNLGNIIATYRKAMNITQEALAQQLGVTNQAVSKWESDQSCPDVMLLPKLADIFGITVDELFGRESKPVIASLPWKNDNTLRVVVYIGHKLVGNSADTQNLTFQYEGPALNIESQISIQCGDVQSNANAGKDIKCGNIGGNADAGKDIYCGNVGGSADAGKDIYCGNVGSYVDAGCSVTCGNVEGDVDAGTSVQCGAVSGSIDAGGSVTIKK